MDISEIKDLVKVRDCRVCISKPKDGNGNCGRCNVNNLWKLDKKEYFRLILEELQGLIISSMILQTGNLKVEDIDLIAMEFTFRTTPQYIEVSITNDEWEEDDNIDPKPTRKEKKRPKDLNYTGGEEDQ